MSLRPDLEEPTDMEPDDRLDEIANILARGIQRLHGRIPGHSAPVQNLPGSSPTCLELSAPSRPDGLAG
jgi:hypothetical protein